MKYAVYRKWQNYPVLEKAHYGRGYLLKAVSGHEGQKKTKVAGAQAQFNNIRSKSL